MNTERLSNRRRVLALVAGAGVTGLAGCFGSDDGDNDSEEDSTSDEQTTDDTGDSADQLSTEEAVAILETYLDAVDQRETGTYSEMHHPSGPLASQTSTDLPRIELESHSVTDEAAGEITFEVTVLVNGGSQETLRVELQEQNDQWYVWDVDFLEPDDPAISVQVAIEELFNALNDGDAAAAGELIRDGNQLESLFLDNIDEIEGDIELDDTRELDSQNGQVEMEVTYTVPSAGETVTDVFIITNIDGTWQIGVDR